MAELNKALTQKNIKDEDEKLELLRSLRGNGYGSLTSIDHILSACFHRTGITNIILDGISSTLVNIDTSINQLVGIMKDFVEKATTAAAPQDEQLSAALTSPTESAGAFVGEGGSAVAVSGNEPILVAIGGIDSTLAEGLAANTEAIKQASKEEQRLQADNTKALIANETKRQQAEDRNRLLNQDKVKEQLGNGHQKMPKLEMPKFPVNGKQFMSGLGKILKGILNPVALIAGIFMHLLPYIILGIAFFKGFWNKLSPELKKKMTEVTKKIVFYAGMAFLLFKGPALLIKTLQLAWYVIKVTFAIAKWGLEVAFHALRMLFTTTEHSAEMAFKIFERVCTMIEHVAELLSTSLEMALNVAAFVLKVAAIVFIVAAIVLLVGGVILIFVLLGDKIVEAVKKIVEVFAMLGGMVYDAVMGILDLFFDVMVELVIGFWGRLITAVVNGFKSLFGIGGDEESKPKTEQETAVKDGVTKDVFETALKPITNVLGNISKCLATIQQAELLKSLNPVGNIFGAVASSVMTLFNGNSNIIKTENADNTQSNISAQYVSQTQGDNPNESIETTLKSINETLSRWFKYVKNQELFVPSGKAEG